MSRALATLLCLAFLLATAATPVAGRAPDVGTPTPIDGEIIPGEVIVTYRAGFTSDTSRVRGLTRIQDLGAPFGDASAPALMSTGGRPVDEVLAELRADPAVAIAEPNYKVFLADGEVTAVPVDDPKTADQYSLDRMHVREAWNRSTGSSNLIAVLDTGVQFSHPDLEGRVVRGKDLVNDDTNAYDDNGHGTWVAGIIAANANDGYGIAGISWTDKILPVKVMNGQGTGNTADLLWGIRWAADSGADVINMSVGGFPYSQQMQDAVNYAFAKGAILVGAAGNNRRDEIFYPASFDNVISVSGTQRADEFGNWSSYGTRVDVSAPGTSVLTTNCTNCSYAGHDTWGPHVYITGTSFATPNVAAVVALIQAAKPDFTAQQVVDRLFSTVDDLGFSGWDKRYGRGRVNAYRALGGTIAAPAPQVGDSLEPNNAIAQDAPRLTMGTTVRPTIYPAGDVDVFTVDVPRAGRLDVRATGVVDSPPYPWQNSGLPVDPIVELYTASGALIGRVDNEWESGTELASADFNGSARVIVRILNWYPNGNRQAYSITPSFVDNVPPVATVAPLGPNLSAVSRFVSPAVQFSEAVSGVTADAVRLRDLGTNEVVPATFTYDKYARIARIDPHDTLKRDHPYRVEVSATIKDAAAASVVYTPVSFTTNSASFSDTAGTSFEYAIEWLVSSGITLGCTAERFCPTQQVTREQMAGLLSRALELPPPTGDYFVDDGSSSLEDKINRLAEAGLTKGCTSSRFCPAHVLSRAQMASLLARALHLPPSTVNHFTDDTGMSYEDAINRLADAGIASGCTPTRYCPNGSVTREQMAVFLYRAFGSDE